MMSSESGSNLVLELAEEFLARYRKGERPHLKEYIDRHPELATEIKEVFPAMAMMENIAVADESFEPGQSSKIKTSGVLQKQLGDFRIIREIGHGGMGVVYEAEQVSLGRHVALKVLPNQAMKDAKQKRRFEREARAAAKLHHTNIVPVFGVGEHDGVPYYVMQFIQGLGLDSVLEELNSMEPGAAAKTTGMPTGGEIRVARRDVTAADVARTLMTGRFEQSADSDEIHEPKPLGPADPTLDKPADVGPQASARSEVKSGSGRLSESFTVASSSITLPASSGTGRKSAVEKQSYWQSVANIGRQVAEALEYAHKQGVLHRDVKPSNLLLDLRGTVWVTDFGLAKVAGTDVENITHTGDILGTLRYMPPEAFDGKSDARGDVYSLGLTLYELVAMRPAFDEKDRNKLIKQVTSGEPASLDKVRREAPRDLVTIVQKSIAREPVRRYATAEDLAADLQRFLDDEPILARRQTHLERYWRWARHNPGIAVLGGMLTAVLVVATIASLIVAGRMSGLAQKETQAAADERIARQQAVDAREREVEQRKKAEAAKKTADESRLETEDALKKARKAEEAAKAEGKRADNEAEFAQRNLFHAQMHLAQQAWREPRGLPYMQRLLANWFPDDESPDRRGWEWFYLNSLPFQNLRTLPNGAGVPNQSCIVAWHAPSKRLAAGTRDGTIRIWDLEREQTTLILKGPGPAGGTHGEARWFTWSPDGVKLAAGFLDGTVHLWETTSGRELDVFHRHNSEVRTVAFSSDGMRLASWELSGQIKIWEVSSGKLTAEIKHTGGVSAGAWSPDNKRVAAGHGDGTVTVSGTQAGDKVVTLKGHISKIHGLAWRPDGSQLASTSFDFTARIWDVASEMTVLGPLRHGHEVTSVAWEPNGKRLATGSIDESVKIWNASTGREELMLRGHRDMVSSLVWSQDGRLASGSNDGSVRIWTSIRDQESSVLAGHAALGMPVRATSVSWSPTGKRLASGGDDGKVRIWDAVTREEILSIKAHDERRISQQFGLIRTLAWSPDGMYVASGGLDGAAKVWEAASGQEVFALPADRGAIWAVAWSSNGTLAVGGQDGFIRVVEGLKQTPKVHAFKAHEPLRLGTAGAHGVRTLAWSPKGDRLASAGPDQLVKVWDPVRGAEIVPMKGHQHFWVMTVAWSPDGKRLASGGADRLVIAWDAQKGQKLSTMHGHNDFVDAVAWSPDGTRLASAGLDNAVRIWDPQTGEETFVLRGNTGMFHDVSWHTDGAQLAAASSDGQIWIWDATRGFERDKTPRALPFIDRKVASDDARGEDVHWFIESYLRTGKSLDAEELSTLRKQILDWLKAELVVYEKLLETGPPQARGMIVLALNNWHRDPVLAGVRNADALTRLPEQEQKVFSRLWADVAALFEKAQKAMKANPKRP